MMYKLFLTPEAERDIRFFKKTGELSITKKIDKLIEELKIHPEIGTGKPEELKHGLKGLWSRRINKKHRLVYKIEESIITVIVLQAKGHYEDK